MPVIICFEGHLATSPIATQTSDTQTPVTTAVVMVNRRAKDIVGNWEDATATRYAIKAWKRRAEALAELEKGSRIVVIGHVETESWTDKESGSRHYRNTVLVDSLGTGLG